MRCISTTPVCAKVLNGPLLVNTSHHFKDNPHELDMAFSHLLDYLLELQSAG